MKKKTKLSKAQREFRDWLKVTGLTVGDRVKIIAELLPWHYDNFGRTAPLVGHAGTVYMVACRGDDRIGYLCLTLDAYENVALPYYCLVKVGDENEG